jgi:tetratricopeptide (TPR) repeat protein
MKIGFCIVTTALLLSTGVFAQKDEFKTLKKIYDRDKLSAKDVMQYKEAVIAATSLVSASNEEDTVYLNFYKAAVPFMEITEAMAKPENQNNPQAALKFFTPEKITEFSKSAEGVLIYETKSSKAIFTKDIQEMVLMIKPLMLSYAISLGDQKRFADASNVLYSIYLLNPTDVEKLYFAANYAINAQDFTTALQYYQTLKDLNFSGQKTNFVATSKLNDTAEYFASKTDRDRAVKIGTHTDPTDEEEPSKRGEIYKNIALILISQDKTEEAKSAIVDARKANPEDFSLIMSEADIYLKTNDMVTYGKLIKEVLTKDPNNADLYYNLGVVSGQNKENEDAEKYYLKAIELKPEYANAYFYLAAIRIDAAELVLNDMNKLSMSTADNKKYDVLKVKRNSILKEVMELLEKTTSLDKKNKEAKEVLLTVYKALEMKEKTKALRAETDK